MHESQIFLNALKLVGSVERGDYLDAVCDGDGRLRSRVDALLRAHVSDPDFLEEPAIPLGETVELPQGPREGNESGRVGAEHVGLVLAGRFKLLELIGEGGMGSVWMAQQTEPVKRLVAVKLVKAGMDTRQVLARFDAERQALALMDHPNIARVFDAGVAPDGRPFFVMELVKGISITRYCDDHHLTPRQRLELFVPVCQAIQHAHQKGIIHRDIKPSNVLVAQYDDLPVPKVIDFGVAKATGHQFSDQTLHTGFGAVVGTVEYMSPEQASFNQLDVDTRSDIYSLGTLLYELLAGSPPFRRQELEAAGMLEMLRVIREQVPSRPSTKLSTANGLPALAASRGTEPVRLTRLIRGELDWIVMKALEKDRTRRYETANGFAADVRRYLADEPVHACPPAMGYRLRKFVRRNLGPVVAGALLMGMLVLTLALALYGKAQVNHALTDRTKAFHLLEAEQQKTDEARRAALQTAHEMQVGLEKLNAANVFLERGRACIDSPHHGFLLRSGAGRAADAFDRAVELRPDNSMALDARGHFLCRLGLFEEAAVDLQRAYALRSVGDIKLDGASYDLWYRYACLRAWTGDLTGYREICARMAEHLGRATDRGATDYWAAKTCGLAPAALADSSHPVRMAQAGVAWQPSFKPNLFTLGIAHYRAGEFHEAIRRLKEADKVATPWEAEPLIWVGLALAHQRLDEPMEAGKWMKRVDLWLDTKIKPVDDPNRLALPMSWWQDWANFQLLYREAAIAVGGSAHADHAAFHVIEARSFAAIGRSVKAGAALAHAARLRPDDQAIATTELPVVLPDDPRQCRRDAEFLVLCMALAEKDMSLSDAQRRLNARGYADQGMALLQEALKMLAAAKPQSATAKRSLIVEYAALTDDALALADLTAARAATRGELELNPDSLHALFTHASVLVLAGDAKEYQQLCEQFNRRLGQSKNPRDANHVVRICTLAPDAVPDPTQLVAIAQIAVEGMPTHAWSHFGLGTAHYRAGQFDLAIQRMNESLKIKSDQEGKVCNWLVLAMAHYQLGHTAEARKWFDQAERWIAQAAPEAPRESMGPLAGITRGSWFLCRVLHHEAKGLLNASTRAPMMGK